MVRERAAAVYGQAVGTAGGQAIVGDKSYRDKGGDRMADERFQKCMTTWYFSIRRVPTKYLVNDLSKLEFSLAELAYIDMEVGAKAHDTRDKKVPFPRMTEQLHRNLLYRSGAHCSVTSRRTRATWGPSPVNYESCTKRPAAWWTPGKWQSLHPISTSWTLPICSARTPARRHTWTTTLWPLHD